MIRENHRLAGLNQFLLMLVNRVIIQAFDQECLLNTQKKLVPVFPVQVSRKRGWWHHLI